MKYKQEQTTAALRRENAIMVYRVLEVRGSDLIARNSLNKGGAVMLAVSNPDDYRVGDYVDMVIVPTGDNSRRIKLVGHTPPEFRPGKGQE